MQEIAGRAEMLGCRPKGSREIFHPPPARCAVCNRAAELPPPQTQALCPRCHQIEYFMRLAAGLIKEILCAKDHRL